MVAISLKGSEQSIKQYCLWEWWETQYSQILSVKHYLHVF